MVTFMTPIQDENTQEIWLLYRIKYSNCTDFGMAIMTAIGLQWYYTLIKLHLVEKWGI